uniref:RING-type E3 ubiquitin transferase n=1 Tax=Blastobotrys adeninivorans TaxID=409370 RepID=A0A060SZ77_BLAAD
MSNMTEEHTCRICRGEATEEEPLYHPCKCSGSIKYVHQDCLLEWLRHSKKKPVCELCKSPYKFAKLYAADMPSHVPVAIVVRKLLEDTARLGKFLGRLGLVIFLWLILLPLTACYVFFLETVLAECVPSNLEVLGRPVDAVVKAFKEPRRPSFVNLPKFVDNLVQSSLIKGFLLDILEGQVIILVLLLTFAVVMLVREWVLQNEEFRRQLRDLAEQEERRERRRDMRRRQVLANRAIAQAHALMMEQRREQQQQPHDGHADNQEVHNDADFLANEFVGHEGNGPQPQNDGDRQERPQGGLRHAPRLAFNEELNRWVFEDANNNIHNNNNNPQQPPFDAPPQFDVDPFADPEEEFDDEPMGEEFDGVLDFLGMRGPLNSLLATYLAINIAAVIISCLLYFLPYVSGRLILANAKYLLEFVFYQLHTVLSPALTKMSQVQNVDDIVRLVDKFQVRPQYANLAQGLGSGIVPRFFGTVTGYAILLSLCFKYVDSNLRFANSRTGRTVEWAVIQFIKLGEAILKVICVIGIELIVFPIFCGLLINIATLPLFHPTGLIARLQLIINYPFISTFIHWASGTAYMFLFALFVTMCRRIMRKGTLYFVRDPNDPEFHPIRDVLDRQLASQINKIGLSGIIYSVLIVMCIGGVIYALSFVSPQGWLPLQLGPAGDKDIMIRLPAVLAAFRLVIPQVLRGVRSLTIVDKTWRIIFAKACTLLRLSSFILNNPRPQEQGHIHYATWWAWLTRTQPDYTKPLNSLEQVQTSQQDQQAYFIRDGTFVRAPDTDSLPPQKRFRLFVRVTKDDERLDNDDNNNSSNGEVEELERYNVVYRPPNFRSRIMMLLGIIWMAGTVLVGGVTLVPLLLGRVILSSGLASGNRWGDIIAYGVGLVPVMGLIHCLDKWDTVKEKTTNYWEQFSNQHLTDMARRLFKVLLLVALAGFVLPFLAGVLLDLYMVVPITNAIYREYTISISVRNQWLYGIFILGALKDVFRIQNDERVRRRMTEIFDNGWTDYDVGLVFSSLALPVFGIACLAITVPLVLGWAFATISYSGYGATEKAMIVKNAYPATLFTLFVANIFRVALDMFNRWQVTVRDQAYLVGEQLENM